MAILKDAAQTWNEFLEGFNLPVYDENTVPEDASIPRLTFNWSEGEFEAPVAISASLWYRSKSWKDVTLKANEIYNAVGYGGRILLFDDGYMWVKRGSPFSQRVSDSDDGVRRVLINFTVEFLRG